MMNSLFCMPGYYLVEECSPTSAGNYEWFTNLFLQGESGRSREKRPSASSQLASQMAAAVPPDGQEIVFLPYIYGSSYNPQARACFVGLDASHTRPQVIRAVLEGIAFCHMVHVEKLLANREAPARFGWPAAPPTLRSGAQIFADVFRLPVETVAAKELGTLGAAMAAAVAAGVYPDLKAAARKMMKIGARFEPDPATSAIYQKKYASYRRVSAALEGVWKEL